MSLFDSDIEGFFAVWLTEDDDDKAGAAGADSELRGDGAWYRKGVEVPDADQPMEWELVELVERPIAEVVCGGLRQAVIVRSWIRAICIIPGKLEGLNASTADCMSGRRPPRKQSMATLSGMSTSVRRSSNASMYSSTEVI